MEPTGLRHANRVLTFLNARSNAKKPMSLAHGLFGIRIA